MYDVSLMNIRLPEMTGSSEDAATRLRKFASEVRRVVGLPIAELLLPIVESKVSGLPLTDLTRHQLIDFALEALSLKSEEVLKSMVQYPDAAICSEPRPLLRQVKSDFTVSVVGSSRRPTAQHVNSQ